MSKVILTILDGFGLNDNILGNAVRGANMVNFNKIWESYPHSKLIASGKAVGLPVNQMGNSEVGHLNIGAGRVVYQPLEVINNGINDMMDNKTFIQLINHTKKYNSKVHLMGLVSDGGVHSHISHIKKIVSKFNELDIEQVMHVFTDGRDTIYNSAINYVNDLIDYTASFKKFKFGSISGRLYSMDRDNKWDRTKLAYDSIVGSTTRQTDIIKVINDNYKENIFDEFITPTTLDDNPGISDNDVILFLNFRTDRATQILDALTNENFDKFPVSKFNNIKLYSMMKCRKQINDTPLFEMQVLKNTLGKVLEDNNLSQRRIAETEKFAHVTYFFDGGIEVDYKNEEKILVPSPKVFTYDLQPEMSANDVLKNVVKELNEGPDFILVNFANPDMVGHTGNYEKTIEALKYLDRCIKIIHDEAIKNKYNLLITADHGNCEEMISDTGEILTAHTTNLVPFIICNTNLKLKDGKLGDIAPTVLTILKKEIPSQMTGTSLVVK